MKSCVKNMFTFFLSFFVSPWWKGKNHRKIYYLLFTIYTLNITFRVGSRKKRLPWKTKIIRYAWASLAYGFSINQRECDVSPRRHFSMIFSSTHISSQGFGRPQEQVFWHIPKCVERRGWTPDPWCTRQTRYLEASIGTLWWTTRQRRPSKLNREYKNK